MRSSHLPPAGHEEAAAVGHGALCVAVRGVAAGCPSLCLTHMTAEGEAKRQVEVGAIAALLAARRVRCRRARTSRRDGPLPYQDMRLLLTLPLLTRAGCPPRASAGPGRAGGVAQYALTPRRAGRRRGGRRALAAAQVAQAAEQGTPAGVRTPGEQLRAHESLLGSTHALAPVAEQFLDAGRNPALRGMRRLLASGARDLAYGSGGAQPTLEGKASHAPQSTAERARPAEPPLRVDYLLGSAAYAVRALAARTPQPGR